MNFFKLIDVFDSADIALHSEHTYYIPMKYERILTNWFLLNGRAKTLLIPSLLLRDIAAELLRWF